MKLTPMMTRLSVIALLTAPLAALAEPAELTGTIAERFDDRIVLDTAEGRILVELDDTAGPAPDTGAQVVVTGDLNGQTLRGATLRVADATTPPPPAPRVADAATDTLPAELANLGLTDILDEVKSDGDRNIRGLLPDGSRFAAEYDNGLLSEMKTEPRRAIPQSLLDAVLSAPVRDRIAAEDVGHIHEVEFESDGTIEIKGRDGMARIEMDIAADGQPIAIEREMGRRGEGRPGPQMTQEQAEQAALDAGYTDIERVVILRRHAMVLATNPDAEQVRIRIRMDGEVTREERR